MTNQADGEPVPNPHCRSCQAALDPADRFCRVCGTMVTADASKPRATWKKHGRRNAAIMLLCGMAIVLFAAVHRDPADLILVITFGLPLFGAGAVTWRSA
jgi:hypothetical protein